MKTIISSTCFNMASKLTMLILYLGFFIHFIYAVPERGIKEMVFDAGGQYKSFAKSLFKDAEITISGEVVVPTENGKPKNIGSLSLNWDLLQSNCAQYFVQVKEDILPALVDEQVPKAHPLHTVYNHGVLTFEDRHLHNKTIVTLEKEIQKQGKTTTAKQSNAEIPDKKNAETPDKKNAETPDKKNAETPDKKNAKTPDKKNAETPDKKNAETPDKKNAKTPDKKNAKTPDKKNAETPDKKNAETPDKTNAETPDKKNAETPDKKNAETPDKKNAETPDKTNSKTPDKRVKSKNAGGNNPQNEQDKKQHRGKRDAAKQQDNEKQPTTSKTTKAMKGPPKSAGLDGNYLLVISLQHELPKDVSVQVKVSIKMNTGYLSAAEWPLLPFYGAMSLVYLAYGVVWLIVSACQWRELLRIQFWIGGVIALGMLEKAVLFSEYNNVNDTGIPAHGLVVLALVLSCIKRTLSRILIIIVSMGFGIVKPRLGAALHRVLGVGCLYFILCVIEGSYREFSVKADVSRKQVIASVPLSVLDAVICWWIFMSLLQTMRTLRIRKNLVKLSLYRHFTNILVVSVIASVAFMVWVIKAHSFNSCIKDWKEIWIDDAFWHFLFALILLAIMVLWRPTANNQRYAFTPLIDVGEDDDDDMTLSDAFQGMKMRGKGEGEAPRRADKQRKKAEDDLKWVEENIPTSGGIDTALPSLLDSDEEMMTTKLEMSKME